jgi:hypothetical protein
MMDWRPEGWENPHVDALAKATGHPDSIYEPIFEAGADAMYQPAHDKGYIEGQAGLARGIVEKMAPHKVAINSILERKHGDQAQFLLGRLDAFCDVEVWLKEKGVL